MTEFVIVKVTNIIGSELLVITLNANWNMFMLVAIKMCIGHNLGIIIEIISLLGNGKKLVQFEWSIEKNVSNLM